MSDSTNNKRWSRREALGILTAAGAAWSSACGSDSPTAPTSTTATATTPATTTTTTTPPATTAPPTSSGACAVTPTETIGPFPSLADFTRSDIRENKQGLPVTLTIAVVNTNSACAPVSGAVVDIWQCDADGNYSQYGNERNLTYLRGLQTTDSTGKVTFVTIYPGWYQGRATHIHIEVTMNGRSVKVTQIAFPETINNAVYGTGVYASRGSNPTSNLQDGIFADSLSSELVTPSGNPTAGYSASYQVGVSV